MIPPVPRDVIGRAWALVRRTCPECSTAFVSHYDQARCHRCGHTFRASEVYGLPPGITLEQLAINAAVVSKEQSEWLLGLLTKPAETLPQPPERLDEGELNDAYTRRREVWEWKCYLLKQALADGGVLWGWSTSSESWQKRCGRCGLAVVKEGRVTAFITTLTN